MWLMFRIFTLLIFVYYRMLSGFFIFVIIKKVINEASGGIVVEMV